MAEDIRFRCESCGAELSARDGSAIIGCAYCGADFYLPPEGADPSQRERFFTKGYDVKGNPALKRAMKWIKRRGSYNLSSFGTTLDMWPERLRDGEVRHIRQLFLLQNLNLHLSRIGDRSLKKIASLPDLKKLNLCHTRVSDAGLKYLAPLKKLEQLNLEMTRVGDAGVAHLLSLPYLERINLKTTKVTEKGIIAAAAMPRMIRVDVDAFGYKKFPLFRAGVAHKCFDMDEINLSLEYLTDEDLLYLKPYNEIKGLDLRMGNIEGGGLRHLSGFRNLMSLSLGSNPITDAGLDFLPDLPSLRTIDLECTKVSDAGLKRLKSRYPNAVIRR